MMKIRKRLTAACFALLLVLSGCTSPTADPEETTVPVVYLGGDLVCVEISRFSGHFIEDGTDEQVTDVAAILVANNTGKFLDLATVTYKVGDRTATFKITGLPAGERAWALEQSRMQLGAEDELVYEDCQVAYNPNPVCATDDLVMTKQGNGMTIENKSGKTLKNVCVYYKNRMSDGTFFGGITYMISFGELAPGVKMQKFTNHLGSESEVVRYSYQPA